MPYLSKTAATGYLLELRRRAGEAGHAMRENDWVMVMAAAEVIVRFGVDDLAARIMDDAVRRVGGRKKALLILADLQR